jgi:hypothetical protein
MMRRTRVVLCTAVCRCRIALLVAMAAAPTLAYAQAQTAAEPALKAAFLYNFAKFTEWPAASLPPRAPIVICTNDGDVARTLADMTNGRAIAGHDLQIQELKLDAPALRACHVLYAADVDATRAAQLLDRVARTSILTVADIDEFVSLGGVAQFFVEEGRVRFRIGVDAVERAQLRMSSQLLSLSRKAQP